MSLANLIGLLGLLGLVGLAVIYLLKPNYEQKMISSTYVWKLSLKYKKRTIPISKLRNLLIILCQILILVLCAFILAEPIKKATAAETYSEKVIILDASASMWAVQSNDDDRVTRFQRAIEEGSETVDGIRELAKKTFSEDGGKVSLILAGREAEVLADRFDASRSEEFDKILDDLIPRNSLGDVDEEQMKCSYASADLEHAMTDAEDILKKNPAAEIYYYTGTEFIDKGNVNVVDVSADNEWNVAILSGEVTKEDSTFYTFTVEVAAYGQPADVELKFEIYGCNAIKQTVIHSETIKLISGVPQKVSFRSIEFLSDNPFDDPDIDTGDTSETAIYEYDWATVYVDYINFGESSVMLTDSLSFDDSYNFYGGVKNKLDVQYYSTIPNTMVNSIIAAWDNTLSEKWDIQVHEVPYNNPPSTWEGQDMYIFEHYLPKAIPSDGVVILLDPVLGEGQEMPSGVNLTFGQKLEAPENNPFQYEIVSEFNQHPILRHMQGEENTVYSLGFTQISASEGWDALMTFGADPTMLLRDAEDQKVLVIAADVNNTNVSIVKGFSFMMLDIFNYFFPGTINKNMFEIGETIVMDSISSELTLKYLSGDPEKDSTVYVESETTKFPIGIVAEKAGRYEISQKMLSGETLSTQFYVKMPSAESNTEKVVEVIVKPLVVEVPQQVDEDLLIYFAAALVALLFAEWWLQQRGQV